VNTVPAVSDDAWAIGLVRTGRVWERSRALGEQDLIAEHMAYLGQLMAAGEVAQAGPVIGADHGPDEDGLVALIVYTVNAERARRLADADPAVRGGMISLDVRPWYAVA
jgi:uncharacterized protein YciI